MKDVSLEGVVWCGIRVTRSHTLARSDLRVLGRNNTYLSEGGCLWAVGGIHVRGDRGPHCSIPTGAPSLSNGGHEAGGDERLEGLHVERLYVDCRNESVWVDRK